MKLLRIFFQLLLLAVLANSASGQSASNAFWQSQSIYQIVTDRFFDGDASNNNADGNYNPSGTTSVHGGDFKGIEQKLDYIKALGATAIWISPIVVNGRGEFHGYAARDFYNVDPHWGSLADLQHMIQTAHAKGLLVIDDIVCNHGGNLVYSTDSGYPTFVAPPGGYNLRYSSGTRYAAPFNTNAINPSLTNLFHNNGQIEDYGVQQQVELGELSGLDDFRTDTAYVRTNMEAIYNFWIAQGFDGFRIDTVKHVELNFWQTWCPVVHSYATSLGKPNFFMFGECLDSSESKCGSYTGTKAGGAFALDSVLDYPLYFTINPVFATGSADTQRIEDHYNAMAANYDSAAQMRLVTFLDNHDQPRFLSVSGATTNRLSMALAFLYSSRGIPCLYYGTEQGFNGSTDPNDREDMFDGQFEQGPSLGDNFSMTHPLFLHIARLNNFRRLYPALRTGTHLNKWYTPFNAGLFSYSRVLGSQEVFVVFNSAATNQTLPNRPVNFPANTRLLNLLDTNETITVTAAQETPPIVVPGTAIKMFLAQSMWQPLDPVVTNTAPSHDAAAVPTLLPLTLHFSEAMNTNSVQTNFAVSPAVAGAFSWSANHDAVTFTPSGVGYAATSLIAVRLTNGISQGSGKSMYAPFEMRFKTASFSDLTPPTIAIQSPSAGSQISSNLLISGMAADNVSVQKVEVRIDGGAWALASGTTSWSLALNSSNFLNGPHAISARATDTLGNVSTTNSVSVTFFNVPGPYLQRISGGGPNNVVDCTGNTWLKDQAYVPGGFGYSGGTTGAIGSTISGICASAQPIYRAERFSTSPEGFTYSFDCPEGIYETTLLEAETYWNATGKRVFNVYIQGGQVLTNFDIYAAAGGMNIPITRVFTNAVTNAQLQVLFTPVADNARVSGIQVRKIGDVYSGGDGIADWWRLGYFSHAGPSAADLSRANDDPDHDGASNLFEFLAGTDPRNAASVFKIKHVTRQTASVQVQCLTSSLRNYQLQRSAALGGAAAWVNIGQPANGSGGVIVLTDNAATNAYAYYRVNAF